MTELQQQSDSPLVSDRGTTTVKDKVVSSIAGREAQGVEGVHMGGSASRTAGGIVESVTGSSSETRGVSVEVGRVETAIDLKMGIDYGKNILQTVDEVRRRITDSVENMTGLRVAELNVTINDVVFPEKEERRGIRSGSGESGGSGELESYTQSAPEVRTMPRSELRPGASEREVTLVEPSSRTHTESQSGPVPEEEVRVEGRPLDESETAQIRMRDQEIEQQRISDEQQTGQEDQTLAEGQTRRPPEES